MFVLESPDIHTWNLAERLHLFCLKIVHTIHSVAVDNSKVVHGCQVHSRSDELRALFVAILVLENSVDEIFRDVLVLVDVFPSFGGFYDPLLAIVVIVDVVAEVRREQIQLPRPPKQLRLQVVDETDWPPLYHLDLRSPLGLYIVRIELVNRAFTGVVDKEHASKIRGEFYLRHLNRLRTVCILSDDELRIGVVSV